MSTRSKYKTETKRAKVIFVDEPALIGQPPVELKSNFVSSMPETPALPLLIMYNAEASNLGVKFRGMRDWDESDMARIIWLRAKIAELWVQRREELAALRRERMEAWANRHN